MVGVLVGGALSIMGGFLAAMWTNLQADRAREEAALRQLDASLGELVAHALEQPEEGPWVATRRERELLREIARTARLELRSRGVQEIALRTTSLIEGESASALEELQVEIARRLNRRLYARTSHKRKYLRRSQPYSTSLDHR